jgi:uncharacterized membrane protein YdjX (TVP38/TMEM64 family)
VSARAGSRGKAILGRVALLVAIGLGLVTAGSLGLFEMLLDPKQTAALLRDMGVWGYLVYVSSFALLSPFFVPGIAFVVPAAMIWPLWAAVPLSLVGATGAGAVGFGFARFVGRDFASQHIPARLHRWDDALVTRPMRTVIVIRLVFFLFPPAHWALGLSRVRFGVFVVGTFIGYIPFTIALSVLGSGVMQWIESRDATAWIWIAVGAAIVVIANQMNRRRRLGSPSVP